MSERCCLEHNREDKVSYIRCNSNADCLYVWANDKSVHIARGTDPLRVMPRIVFNRLLEKWFSRFDDVSYKGASILRADEHLHTIFGKWILKGWTWLNPHLAHTADEETLILWESTLVYMCVMNPSQIKVKLA